MICRCIRVRCRWRDSRCGSIGTPAITTKREIAGCAIWWLSYSAVCGEQALLGLPQRELAMRKFRFEKVDADAHLGRLRRACRRPRPYVGWLLRGRQHAFECSLGERLRHRTTARPSR